MEGQGLGFHGGTTVTSDPDGRSGDDGAADRLLRQYMQECLSYHNQHAHQQPQHASLSAQAPPQPPPPHPSVAYAWHQPPQHQNEHLAMSVPLSAPPMFVSGDTIPASFVSPAPPPPPQTYHHETNITHVNTAQHVQIVAPAQHVQIVAPAREVQSSDVAVSQCQNQQQQQVEHDKAIDDALAIAMCVKPSSSAQPRDQPAQHVGPAPTNHPVPASIDIPTKSPSEYSAARAQHAERERKRLRAALLRNFEYVARRDEADMKRHMEELERQRTVGMQMEERHKRSMEQRVRASEQKTNAGVGGKGGGGGVGAASTAGIGTKSRQKIEKVKKREGHVVIDTSKQRELRCAVYITGLPVEESAIDEDLLAQLFGSYGTIKRVTLYVDKRTGRRKGDGLVVYDTSTFAGSSGWKAAEYIVRSACEQMNGAELPCGSNISVEPADADYKNRSSNASLTSEKGPKATASTTTDASGTDSCDVGCYGPSATAINQTAPVEPEIGREGKEEYHGKEEALGDGGEGGDDLDDFFYSLT